MITGKRLRIYFTSDCHGHFFPMDYSTGKPKVGGLLNLMTQFDKDDDTLIIDGGDILQGSAFTQLLSEKFHTAEPIARVMNMAGYDYVTLGNHDFMYGYEFQKTYLKNLNAKCICCNITDTTGCQPIFSTVIHTMKSGLRIGLVGMCTDWVKRWESSENMMNFQVEKVLDSLPKVVETLREQVSLLIGIYHGGFENDVQTHRPLSDTGENVGYAICKAYDFDLLLTGHQHKSITNIDLLGTHIVQTPPYATSYALVELTEEGGLWQIKSGLHSAPKQTHQKAYEELLPYEKAVQHWLDEPVGYLPQALLPDDRIEMALHGSPLTDFIGARFLDATGADVACHSLSNVCAGLPQNISRRDIIALFSFPNVLVVKRVTGAVLKSALERTAEYFDWNGNTVSVSRTFLEPKVEHYHFDFYYGLDFTYCVTQPIGQRVRGLRFRGKAVEEDDELLVAMTSFRATGTGGYDMYVDCPIVRKTNEFFTDFIIEWFQKHASSESKLPEIS